VVTLNGTQTLTNKTLTSPTITGTGTIAAATVTLSSTLAVTGVSTLTGGAVIQGLTVGRGAGAVATNTAVGSGALQANTSGSQSTAVGYQAGYSNTTGGANVFLGYQAGYTQTTGGGGAGANTYLGYRAGYLSTGYYNTFVGIQAGQNCTGFSNTFVGSTGTMASGDQMTTGTKNIIIGNYSGNNDGLDIRTASNYAVISDGDGNRLLSTANGQTLALDSAVPNAGTGITFPATQSASSDANTLDDYEEGTWTPTVVGDATAGTYTVVPSGCVYTKIGRMVALQFNMTFSAASGGSGSAIIGNLPFAIGNSGLAAPAVLTARFLDTTASTSNGLSGMRLQGTGGVTSFGMVLAIDNANWEIVSISAIGTSTEIVGQMTYIV
jgi:hypothetical protein